MTDNNYDNIIGYSPLDAVDIKKMIATVINNKRLIEKYRALPQNSNDEVLVAGAGNGQEARIISEVFNLKTIGVDINIDNKVVLGNDTLVIEKQDLMNLKYEKNRFAMIYCNHVLEHVDDHYKVLSELSRVLSKGGILYIGFPNRNRLIGYIGASQRISVIDIIKWNLHDYKYRLCGKFKNKYGAHAGFTQSEFIKDAHDYFSKIISVRNDYMLLKYSRFKHLLAILNYFKLGEVTFPSNYFICLK